jgi:hypothetical protein
MKAQVKGMKVIAWMRSHKMDCLVLVMCAAMVLFAPIYAMAGAGEGPSWTNAYNLTPRAAEPQAPPVEEPFGRHLDTLTSFYGTVITVLTVLLAAVLSLAFFTVKAGSRSEMDRALREIVESKDFKDFLRDKIQVNVASGIEEQLGNVQDLVEELQRLYEALDDIVVTREREVEDGDR